MIKFIAGLFLLLGFSSIANDFVNYSHPEEIEPLSRYSIKAIGQPVFVY